MSTTVGRLEAGRAGKVVADQGSEGEVAAILSKQDEIIDLLKALADKLDNDAGVSDTDYVSSLTDALEKVNLTL